VKGLRRRVRCQRERGQGKIEADEGGSGTLVFTFPEHLQQVGDVLAHGFRIKSAFLSRRERGTLKKTLRLKEVTASQTIRTFSAILGGGSERSGGK